MVRALTAAGIEYMVTGSVAASAHGLLRATHDIDLVVALRADAITALVSHFPEPDYYLDEYQVRDALRTGMMFNLLHIRSGDKVDFWLLASEPFARSQFHRRRALRIFGVEAFAATPEDVILQKLHWLRDHGATDRHFDDALRVYEMQKNDLDQPYLDEWAGRISVTDLLERIRMQAANVK